MAGMINPSSSMDMQVQQQAIERQRKLAEALQQQSMQAPEGGMVSGHYVAPSPTQYLAKLLQGVSARDQLTTADRKQADLLGKSNDALVNGLMNYQEALQGTPAETFAPGGDGMGPAGTRPAIAGSQKAAMISLLKSGNPMLQQVGAQQMLAKPESQFSKVDPKDYTQASVAKFAQTQNFADLVPARKMEVAPSGVAYNPYSVQEGAVFNDPNKLMSIGPDGNPVVNQSLVGIKKDIAKSGAPNVNVKTNIKMNEGVAAQVGPMMKDSQIAAQGAVQQVDAANRIIQAVDSNKLYAGPMASTRLKLAQVGDLIGVSGADEKEKIANTRQAIRGLSEMTLQGRKSMRGEGAITESEGKLAERAFSGDIDELTPAEIKQLAKASERAARFLHAEHNRKVEQMRSTPGLEGVTPFYEVPALPAQPAASPASEPAAPGGWSIKPL